jgi:hypothetical protein
MIDQSRMKATYNLIRQLRNAKAHVADLPFVIPASLKALTFLTTPKASLEHIVSTTNYQHSPFPSTPMRRTLPSSWVQLENL